MDLEGTETFPDDYKYGTIKLESNVRTMSTDFFETISQAHGPYFKTLQNHEYFDLTSGAGAMNYGFSHKLMKEELIKYIKSDGITNSLDYFTTSREKFMKSFNKNILSPRNLKYSIQFTGPTGANSVEAALKLARKITKRKNVAAFTGAYHGLSLGALSASSNDYLRKTSENLLDGIVRLPYDGYFSEGSNAVGQLRKIYSDPASGYDKPAAFIVETIQGKGGMRTASQEWLRGVQQLAKDLGSLFIIDDIFAGGGRTGDFFSWEKMGLSPDIVCLSKSVSGYGLPLSLLLIKPESDLWSPGEHAGTFRGNSHAFVTGSIASELWSNPRFIKNISELIYCIEGSLGEIHHMSHGEVNLVGRGLMRGLKFNNFELTKKIILLLRNEGIYTSACGGNNEVLKILPPLITEVSILLDVLDRVKRALIKIKY
ncbi:diaminobutyrate--2-oxoglutarate transaminase [Hafnia psychrotolerans]|uniref:Diaminobutyrate--2-oxoglutarate transaminase n=1 Tax=Hafnia psychrotolerans TaxID=1477018 RepID=A0ABQ1GIN5_9GAMM|nr:diaminobutyrate--2-oxoglutarate transaminase [Hafnia psychrotolerans]GGA44545.1 diaminobutyrate--2-oxoglutarate transaminase [Hafnia psychrotolerans]